MSDTTNGRPKRTVVEEGTEFKGTLSASCPIVIMGKVEGELSGPTVEVSDSGILSGRAKVNELRSRGELAGDLEAEQVELAGRVRDKTIIRAKSLHVASGAPDGELQIIFGDCELQIGEAPNKAQAVAEAAAANKPAARNDAGVVSVPADNSATVPVSTGEASNTPAPEVEHGGNGGGGRRSKKSNSERPAEGA